MILQNVVFVFFISLLLSQARAADWIVKFKSAANAKHALSELRGSHDKLPLLENAYVVHEADDSKAISHVAQMQNSLDVTYAQSVHHFAPLILQSNLTTPAPKPAYQTPPPVIDHYVEDPQRGANWNIPFNGVYEAWKYSKGKDVVVAVLDTGVDYNHEDLQHNIWTNAGETGLDAQGHDKRSNQIDDDGNGYIDDFMGWDFTDNTNLPYDEYGHGTHVAGIIAQEEGNGIGGTGVAPQAKIMNLRFLGADGKGDDVNAIRALDYALKKGAQIINNSWGGRDADPALEDAFKALENSGILIVNAAGNDGADIDDSPAYPARYKFKNTITVAANLDANLISYYSNYSTSLVQMSAAGDSITSTLPGNKYGHLSGTSMAAPQVSAEAALALALRPNLTPDDIKNLFKNEDAMQPLVMINDPIDGQYTRDTEWHRYSHPGFSISWLAGQ